MPRGRKRMDEEDSELWISPLDERRLQTLVRRKRAALDELERWQTRQLESLRGASDTGTANQMQWYLWTRRIRIAAVRAELTEAQAILAEVQRSR